MCNVFPLIQLKWMMLFQQFFLCTYCVPRASQKTLQFSFSSALQFGEGTYVYMIHFLKVVDEFKRKPTKQVKLYFIQTFITIL